MRKAWNKGLSKLNNESVRKVSEKKMEWWKTHDTTETRKKIGEASKGRPGKKMEESVMWKGGRYISSRDGYIMVYVGCGKYKPEHRYIMEGILGRELTLNEEVHHINGIKDDNRVDNLRLVVKSMHYGKVVCPCCGLEFDVK